MTRDAKQAFAAFAGGVLVGFLASRLRVSAQLDGLAAMAAQGYGAGRRLNPSDLPAAALRGILSELR